MFERISSSFHKQGLMKTLGADLVSVEKGKVRIDCGYHYGITQQHGFFHAGVVASLADSACGYAALTMMPANYDVLSIEFKSSFMRPAKGSKIIAIGKVLKTGKTLTFCEGEVWDENQSVLFAKMTATMIGITAK